MENIFHINEQTGIVYTCIANGLAKWGPNSNCGNDGDSDDD